MRQSRGATSTHDRIGSTATTAGHEQGMYWLITMSLWTSGEVGLDGGAEMEGKVSQWRDSLQDFTCASLGNVLNDASRVSA
nr:hypothetical protein CFP56_73165 [Quercus suber]